MLVAVANRTAPERPSPGSPNPKPGEMMGSEFYGHPRYGTGDPVGRAFVGMGRIDRACNIPNEMQPWAPPGGIFGPDAPMPWGDFPGYKPPPDWMYPGFPEPHWPGFWGRRPSGIPGPELMIAYAPGSPGPPTIPQGPWGRIGPGGHRWRYRPRWLMASAPGRPWGDFDPTMPLGPPSIEDLTGDPSEGFEYPDGPAGGPFRHSRL